MNDKNKRNYQINMRDTAFNEWGSLPKKIQKSFNNTKQYLISAPSDTENDVIKKLKGFKDRFRIRVGEKYRCVYKVDTKNKTVDIEMVGHRDVIYKRLNIQEDGALGARIILSSRDHELLDPVPSNNEIKNALEENLNEPIDDKVQNKLPMSLDEEKLKEWDIPEEFYEICKELQYEDDLLNAAIPNKIIEKILGLLYPSNIEDIHDKVPLRSLNSNDVNIEEISKKNIEDFVLYLSEEQKEFVDKFRNFKTRPQGPWLLKGGPGSGKSMLALYCIKYLIEKKEEELDLPEPGSKQVLPLKILFTTFTKSLVNTNEELLKKIVNIGIHKVVFKTVDSLAFSITEPEYRSYNRQGVFDYEDDKDKANIFRNKIEEFRNDDDFDFTTDDSGFLQEEIEWIILGNNLKTYAEYKEFSRMGRKKQLGPKQRLSVWRLFENIIKYLVENKKYYSSNRIQDALKKDKKERFDFVFVDEAQDLKPIELKLCAEVGKNFTSGKNIFITADTNQSIYGVQRPWSKISDDIQVKGRTTVLRNNYRNTKEIWRALIGLANASTGKDLETLESVNNQYSGEIPTLIKYKNLEGIKDILNQEILDSLKKEKTGSASIALLCQSGKGIDKYLNILSDWNPRKMNSRNVNYSYNGLKAMTMHAAKGLEFPIVIIGDIEKGEMPLEIKDFGDTEEEHIQKQIRLLFVACSRAKRKLIVLASEQRKSIFYQYFNNEDYWNIL